jgi:phosphatidylglycerophosphate synthase
MATRVVPAPLAQIPNALTVLRLVAIPVFVVLMLTSPAAGTSSRSSASSPTRWPTG